MGKDDKPQNQNLITFGAIALTAAVTGALTWFFTKNSQTENCMQNNSGSTKESKIYHCGDCSICLEPESIALKCGHVFHPDCISKMIDNGIKECPLCRAPINL